MVGETRNVTLENVVREASEHFALYGHAIKSGDRVLDVGIGPAITSDYISQNRQDLILHGLDVVDIRRSPLVPITLYEGMTFPFNTKSFDVSLVMRTLRHIKWPLLTLGEIARVTKRQIVIIEDFATEECDLSEDARAEARELRSLGIFLPLTYSPLAMRELENMFVKHNLTIRKKEQLKISSNRRIERFLYILDSAGSK